MTAVVGILNKEAVAIAADSAVTLSNNQGRKIMNRANKIFALSKYHPVGIMLFNSATFMGTPWEIIIKMYRQNLKDRAFDTVQAYQDDFIQYLKGQPLFSNQKAQEKSLAQFCYSLLEFINSAIFRENRNFYALPQQDGVQLFLQKLEEKLNAFSNEIQLHTNKNQIVELIGFSKETFGNLAMGHIEAIINALYTQNGIQLTEGLKEKVISFLFLAFCNYEDKSPFTGLVFTGYGTDEIYPTLNCINISFGVGDKLRYHHPLSYSVTEDKQSAIFPFAQTDVIDTILTGSDPKLWDIFTINFAKFIDKYNDLIFQAVGATNPNLVQSLQGINIEQLVKEFIRNMEEVRKNDIILPLMAAVGTLSREDLAEMAESLIYLTYLKRRFTFAEESVGGPVDVAVISKGDGFIWMKRKHYFKPELNAQFFNNYFK